YSSSDSIEIVSIRLTARGLRRCKLEFRTLESSVEPNAAPVGERRVFCCPTDGWLTTPVYDRAHIPPTFEGPAILEGSDSTVVVPPAASARLDDFMNLHLKLA